MTHFQLMFSKSFILYFVYPISEMELTSLLELQELEANQKMTKLLMASKELSRC